MSRGFRVQRHIRIQRNFPRPAGAPTHFGPGQPVATERFRSAGRYQCGALASRGGGPPRFLASLFPHDPPRRQPTRGLDGSGSCTVRFPPEHRELGNQRTLSASGRQTVETGEVREDRRRFSPCRLWAGHGSRRGDHFRLRHFVGPDSDRCRGRHGFTHSSRPRPDVCPSHLGIGHRRPAQHRSSCYRGLGASVGNARRQRQYLLGGRSS